MLVQGCFPLCNFIQRTASHSTGLEWSPGGCGSVGKESTCNAGDPGVIPGSGRCWRRDRLPTQVFLGFPCGWAGKEFACYVGDLGSIPWLGRFSGEGKGCPLQCSGLENPIHCIAHGVAKSPTWLSNFHFHWWSAPLPHMKYLEMFVWRLACAPHSFSSDPKALLLHLLGNNLSALEFVSPTLEAELCPSEHL